MLDRSPPQRPSATAQQSRPHWIGKKLMGTILINHRLAAGYVDTLSIEPCGLIRLAGWTFASSPELLASLELELPSGVRAPCQVFRTFRPDVAAQHGPSALRSGFCAEFLIWDESVTAIRVFCREGRARNKICEAPVAAFSFERPAYEGLFHETRPLRRAQIYGTGPPVNVVVSEIALLIDEFEGDVLDFGCGAGALVRALHSRGRTAYGLELDRGDIRHSLRDDVISTVRLYDGSFPAPFPSKSFDTLVAVEVIEHIEDYCAALKEMARLTRDRLILTTPDMSAIPLLYPHQAIPWHLLEATHVSFFTQNSLAAALNGLFDSVEIMRIGPNTINGTLYYTSLLAVCREPRA